MGNTSIEWTEKSWNVVRGCSRVSPGCLNCYAEKIAARFSDGETVDSDGVVTNAQPFHLFASRTPQPHWTGKMGLVEDKLLEPLSWRKPCRVFVNSMSDLFHEDLAFEDIDQVFTTMVAAPDHTYQILTKRAERMHDYFSSGRHDDGNGPDRATYHLGQSIWLGVSVENQRYADERIPWLLKTPADVRFVSYEPALGPVDLRPYAFCVECATGRESTDGAPCNNTKLDWVICGGESGQGARPMHPDWARSVRDQCKAAGVAFFFKQWGEFQHGSSAFGGPKDYVVLNDGRFCREFDLEQFHADNRDATERWPETRATSMGRVGKKAAGHLLDGVEHHEFPEART